MTKNIYGGGSKTNENGLQFEQETSLSEALLKIDGYKIINNLVYFKGNYIGIEAGKNLLYTKILVPKNIDYTKILSKKLLPDEAFYNAIDDTIYIVEKKFQSVAGSVDEKLQTCGFKKRQYIKLFNPLCIKVVYLYVLNDWFKQPQYKDVLEYIRECGCIYFFNEIPLDYLHLPR